MLLLRVIREVISGMTDPTLIFCRDLQKAAELQSYMPSFSLLVVGCLVYGSCCTSLQIYETVYQQNVIITKVETRPSDVCLLVVTMTTRS